MAGAPPGRARYLEGGVPKMIAETRYWSKNDEMYVSFKGLVLGYFAAGGMQLQVTCASKEDMLDALDHPERHEDLMVRTGGYSEYFNRLSAELKRTIIARPEF